MISPEQREQLARNIHIWVSKTFSDGGGDEQLLETMYEHMPLFTTIMDNSTHQELDALTNKYLGFNRFANLLESLTTAIADGRINPDEFEPTPTKPRPKKGFG